MTDILAPIVVQNVDPHHVRRVFGEIVTRVNLDEFRGFPPNTVQVSDCTCQQTASGDWTATVAFKLLGEDLLEAQEKAWPFFAATVGESYKAVAFSRIEDWLSAP